MIVSCSTLLTRHDFAQWRRALQNWHHGVGFRIGQHAARFRLALKEAKGTDGTFDVVLVKGKRHDLSQAPLLRRALAQNNGRLATHGAAKAADFATSRVVIRHQTDAELVMIRGQAVLVRDTTHFHVGLAAKHDVVKIAARKAASHALIHVRLALASTRLLQLLLLLLFRHHRAALFSLPLLLVLVASKASKERSFVFRGKGPIGYCQKVISTGRRARARGRARAVREERGRRARASNDRRNNRSRRRPLLLYSC